MKKFLKNIGKDTDDFIENENSKEDKSKTKKRLI